MGSSVRTLGRAVAAIALVTTLVVAPTSTTTGVAQTPSVEHVVHISVDGVNASTLDALMAADPTSTAAWHRLVSEGASTFNARSDYFSTSTLPNHVSMVTARPVSLPDGLPVTTHHGWTENVDPDPGETLHNAGNPNLTYVVSSFDVAHDHGLSTALYTGKSKFSLFDVSYDAANGATDITGADNGSDKIDSFVYESLAATMQSRFVADLVAQDYNYSFVHYATPDAVGHASGWDSTEYLNALRTIDGYLGEVLDAIENDATLDGRTVVILTSDHGGGTPPTEHGDPTAPTNYTIPLFVWGPGVTSGADLYALNSHLVTDPGATRPTYTDPGQPIRNGATGTLALDLLGLPPVSDALMTAALQVSDTTTNSAPIVTNPGPQTSTLGDTVTLAIEATDLDEDPLTYSATGLPPTLTIDAETGIVTGTTTAVGTYVATVIADDLLTAGDATFTWIVRPVSSGTVDVRVTTGFDDIEEIAGTGQMYLDSSDLEFVTDSSYMGNQSVGIRFNDIQIPQGATITSSHVVVVADETDSAATSLEIRAEASDDAGPFTMTAFDLTNRPKTTAAVAWPNVPAWTSVGEAHTTPSLASVVQEVVNRPGWEPGNSVVIVVTGYGERTAESFEGDATRAALLHVEYIGSAVDAAPQVTIGSPVDGAVVAGTVTISVTANDTEDPPGTLDVAVQIDTGPWIPAPWNPTNNRYETSWDTTTTSDGPHTLIARATDTATNTTTTPPTNTTVTNAVAADPYDTLVLADGALAYWRLGESTGTTAVDTAGSHDGIYTGTPILGQPGLINDPTNTAVRFDGNNDVVKIPDSTDINTGGPYENRTWELWFTAPNVTTRQVLYEEGGGARGMSMYLDNGLLYGGLWNRINDGDGTTPWTTDVFLSTPVTTGTTYHVVLVYDYPADHTTLYVNSTPVATATGMGRLHKHAANIAIGAADNNVRFHDTDHLGNGYFTTATIDEVALYPTSLTPTTITTHHTTGIG